MWANIAKARPKMRYKNFSAKRIIPHLRHKSKHNKAESAFNFAGFVPARRACMGY